MIEAFTAAKSVMCWKSLRTHPYSYPMPSPEFENLLQAFKAQRTGAAPELESLRAGYDVLGQVMPIADVVIEPDTIGGISGERLTPAGAPDDRLIVHFHGGGYCIGSCSSHRPYAAALAHAAGVQVFLADYRRAPENPFPAAVDDARAVYGGVREAYDASKIVLSGDSAGAGLALALQLALRDDGQALPAGSVLVSPWSDMSGLGEVSEAALEDDYLRPEQIALFTQSYLPTGDVGPLNSPLSADLTGLPPMLIQGGEHEILLDQIRRLAAHAKDCGVDVTLEVEPRLFHDWHVFTVLPETADAMARIARFANERLS
jgi:acetyl esterase/lipase